MRKQIFSRKSDKISCHQNICTTMVPLFHFLLTSFTLCNKLEEKSTFDNFRTCIRRQFHEDTKMICAKKRERKKNCFVFNPTTNPLPLGTGTFSGLVIENQFQNILCLPFLLCWTGARFWRRKIVDSRRGSSSSSSNNSSSSNSRPPHQHQQSPSQPRIMSNIPMSSFTLRYVSTVLSTINNVINAHFVGKRIDRGLLDRLMVFLYTEEICC
jgi:hypothetical protein